MPTSSGSDIELYDPEMDSWLPLSLADEWTDDGKTKKPRITLEGLFSAEADATIAKRLLPQVQEDWSRGMGLDYDWAPGLYTRSPGYVAPAGAATDIAVPTTDAGAIVAHEEYAADAFFAQVGTAAAGKGGRVLRLTGGTGTLSESLVLADGQYMRGLLTADDGSGGTALYAFSSDGGVANGYLHRWAGSSWTSTTSGEFGGWGRGPAKKVFWTPQNGVGAPRIVTISGPRTISYTKPNADPMLGVISAATSSWVEGVRIGGSRGQLRDIAAFRRHIYVSAEDGLFDLTELGESTNVMQYVEGMVTAGNGYAVHAHDGAVFYSLGTGLDRVVVDQPGLLQEQPGQCGPGWGTRAENPVLGWTTAMCTDQGYLVAAIFNPVTRQSFVCYGKSRSILQIDGPNPMIWYGPELVLTSNYRITKMSVSSLVSGTRRLFVSSITDDGATTRLSWMSLPYAGQPLQNLYSDTGHKYTTGQAGGSLQPSASLFLLSNTWADKPSMKILHEHAIGTRGLSVDRSGVDDGYGTKLVEYDRADPTPGSVDWGTGTDVTVTPSQKLAPSTPIKGFEIGRRIDFISPQGGATTPRVAILTSLRTTAWKVAPSFTVVTMAVEYGAGVVDQANGQGNNQALDPDYITSRIEALIEYGPVVMRDHRDKRWNVKLEQVLNRENVWHDEPPGKTVKASLEVTVISEDTS